MVEVSPHADRLHAATPRSRCTPARARPAWPCGRCSTAPRPAPTPAASTPALWPRPATCIAGRAGHRGRRPPVAGRVRRRPSSTRPPPCSPRKPDTRFLPALRRANVRGALDMGLAPGPAARPGHASTPAATGSRSSWPQVPRRARPRLPPASSRPPPTAASTCSCCSAPTRSSDFPDHDLAARALAGAGTHRRRRPVRSPPAAGQADVVLPAAGFAEVDGTTTNLEGRVSAAQPEGHRRRAPPSPTGSSPPSWPRALGADLRLESVEAIRAEIAPAGAGLHRAASDGVAVTAGRRPADGVVVPAAATDAARPTVDAVDPDLGGPTPAARADRAGGPRPLLAAPGRHPQALRRRACSVQHSPSLAGLAPGSLLRVNPYDFDRLGVAAGDRGAVALVARPSSRVEIAADAGVPAGHRRRVLQPAGPARPPRSSTRPSGSPTSESRPERGDHARSPTTRCSSVRSSWGVVRHRGRQGRHRLRAAAGRRRCS